MGIGALKKISRRFAGLLPVVVDCETGGVCAEEDALLELAACAIVYDQHKLVPLTTKHYHVEPFHGAHISKESLDVTQIRPDHPFRFAVTEKSMLLDLNDYLQKLCKKYHCRRAVLVGHNAMFDLNFLQAAYKRVGMMDQSVFHRFVTFDTATITGCWVKETVLAKAMMRYKMPFDVEEAHSALYDCEKTADLFCSILNEIDTLKGF